MKELGGAFGRQRGGGMASFHKRQVDASPLVQSYSYANWYYSLGYFKVDCLKYKYPLEPFSRFGPLCLADFKTYLYGTFALQLAEQLFSIQPL